MKIVEIREKTVPISSPIRNAYIDFSKMTLSLVAVVTDVIRDGKPVIGYGFNSNGRYGQGTLMRERFIPRILEADPASLVDDAGTNLDPHKIWNCMFTNEKPGGHGERSVAIGTIDMAVWDAVAKIEGKPLFQLLADRYGNGQADRKIFVYAAGGYYYPGQDHGKLKDEMRSYIDRGYTVVKKKIGVDRQFLAVLQHAQYGVDAAQVFVEVGAADFLFHHRVTTVDVAAHFVLQIAVVLARIVITAGRVHENLAVGLAVAIAVGQQLEQRLAFDLGHCIPDRHVDGAAAL